MKTTFLSLVSLVSLVSGAYSQTLPLGSIVEEDITFSQGTPNGSFEFLENLRVRNYREFDGEVLLVVYHASW